MDIRTLRYFLAVVEHGSITHAADALRMTQPPLSATIAKLERTAGCTLLRRSKQGVEPTAAGSFLVARAEQHLQDIDETLRSLRRMATGIEGHLFIAAEPTTSAQIVPDLLARFTKTAPLVEISLIEAHPTSVIDQVTRGRADVGLVPTTDFGTLERNFAHLLRVHPWRNMRLALALPEHFRDSEDPIDLRELAQQHWLLPPRTSRIPSLQSLIENAFESLGLEAPEMRAVSPLHTALPLVAAGLGITIVPEVALSGASSRIVVRRPLQHIPPLVGVILERKGRETSAIVDRFVRLASSDAVAAEGDHLTDPT